jgi:hypothetical protein
VVTTVNNLPTLPVVSVAASATIPIGCIALTCPLVLNCPIGYIQHSPMGVDGCPLCPHCDPVL